MALRKESVVFNGLTYTRYPNAKQRAHRVYFRTARECPDKRALHVAVYESVNGPVPKGRQVHHKDENPLNNNPENLEALTPREHSAKHPREYDLEHLARIRPLTVEWHSSPDGIEWHRKHGAESWDGRQTKPGVCERCGDPFEKFFDRARFCSRLCLNRYHEARRPARNRRKIVRKKY